MIADGLLIVLIVHNPPNRIELPHLPQVSFPGLRCASFAASRDGWRWPPSSSVSSWRLVHQQLPGHHGGSHHALVETEDDVPGQVARGERRDRVVIHEDQVGLGPAASADRGGHQTGRWPARHYYRSPSGRYRCRHAAGVAIPQLVHQVGCFPFLPHRVREAIVPQPTMTPARRMDSTAETPTPLFIFERGWWVTQVPVSASSSISRASTCTACTAMVPRPQDAVLVQPVDHPQAGFRQAVVFIGRILSHVDVEAQVIRAGLRGRHPGWHRTGSGWRAGQRWRPAAPRPGVRCCHPPGKAHVFGNPFPGPGFSVPIGHLVAQGCPQPDCSTASAISSSEPVMAFGEAWWSIRVVVPWRMASTRHTRAE